jgi:hypothetical protein
VVIVGVRVGVLVGTTVEVGADVGVVRAALSVAAAADVCCAFAVIAAGGTVGDAGSVGSTVGKLQPARKAIRIVSNFDERNCAVSCLPLLKNLAPMAASPPQYGEL